MINYCENCGHYFTDSEIECKKVCLESYYGVGSDFDSYNYGYIDVCPNCESDDFTELSENEVTELLNGR